MAGEIVRTEAVCLAIHPWSRTSQIVSWLTPSGKVTTVVKGALRPKSFFLGQYDLNYTCEILYYARAKGDLHALRECAPLILRERLRGDYRSLALAGYFAFLADRLAPQGPECRAWYEQLTASLDALASPVPPDRLRLLISFELATLHLLGLEPDVEAEAGSFLLRGERAIPISGEVAALLRRPSQPSDERVALDAARIIGVYYDFHVGLSSEIRRSVLGVISRTTKES